MFIRVTLAVLLLSSVGNAQEYVPGEVIVKLKGSLDSSDTYQFMGKVQSEKDMQLKRAFSKIGVYHYKLGKSQSVDAAISDLMLDPDVEYAEPNYIIRKSSTGVITPLTQQELESMQLIEDDLPLSAVLAEDPTIVSAKVSTSSFKPVVAVLDTGLQITHPVFSTTGALWVNTDEIASNGIDDDGNGYIDDVNGWNFVSNNGAMIDDDGHGTHVSGIILKVDAAFDIVTFPHGTAKYEIMPLKFLDGTGSGTTSDAIKAIYYAVANGAHVLNNSWGGTSYSTALHEAIVHTYNNGVAFSAAAGNSGINNDVTPMYPASYDVPHVMSVAATTSLDFLASFSNFGASTVHMGSLGQNVYSTIPGGYGTSSGTSMATPYVSGLAALMLIEQPTMLGYQIKTLIFQGADTLGSLSGKLTTEARMNASSSIALAQSASVDSSQPGYTITRMAASGGDGGGGCGLVTKLSGNDKNPPPNNFFILMALALMAIPLLYNLLMRSNDPKDRRRYDRFSVDTAVSIRAGGQELVGSISSLSMGGVQVNTEALLEKGGVVSMKISNPEGGADIEVKGEIVWSEAQKAYGVQFSKPKRSVLQQIAMWTQKLSLTD